MNRPKGQKKQKKATAKAVSTAARQVVAAITHSSTVPKLKKRRNRKSKQNLGNHSGGTGRLGLSSVNRSSTRLKQVIEEDEYIADINGSVAFATTQYSVNIGQAADRKSVV